MPSASAPQGQDRMRPRSPADVRGTPRHGRTGGAATAPTTQAPEAGGLLELTVAAALALDELDGITVLAGHAGLERIVTGVNIIEVPDVWQWLNGGEFLLTSGYPWRDDPEQLVPLLEQLAVTGISAVGFKLGSYMQALPPQLSAAADALRIPLLVMPPTMAYRDVFEPLYSRLLSLSAGGAPSRSTDQVLLRFGLDDQSIDKVAGALAGQLGRQVRVVDLLDDVVHVAAPDGTCAVRAVDRLDDGTRALVDTLAEHHLRRQITPIEEGGTRALAAALVVGRRRHGYILVLDHQPGDEHRSAAEVDHAAELVSFLLLKRIAFREGRRQASSLFFESLMSDALTEGEATERASALGIRLAKPSSVVIVGMLGDGQLLTDEWNLLRQHFERCMGPETTTATAEVHGGRLQALVQTSLAGDPWGSLMRCLEDRSVLRPGLLPVLAVGAPGVGRDGVRRCRREALIAYQTAQRIGRHGVIRFGDLGVERLLSQIPMTPLTQGYVDSLLGGLVEEPELLHTLEVYLEHGGNKSATAAAMPLHRSSLLYRLGKISRAVGADLNDPERCNELWLALRLRRMIGPPG